MATVWIRPTVEQAHLYAQCLEAGLAGEDVLGEILPELETALRPEIARRWNQDDRVRSVQFELRAWLAKGTAERVDEALTHAYTVMALWVRQQTFGGLESAKLAKFLTAVSVLEKKHAGSAGKADAVTAFLEQFQRKIADGSVVVKGKPATH